MTTVRRSDWTFFCPFCSATMDVPIQFTSEEDIRLEDAARTVMVCDSCENEVDCNEMLQRDMPNLMYFATLELEKMKHREAL